MSGAAAFTVRTLSGEFCIVRRGARFESWPHRRTNGEKVQRQRVRVTLHNSARDVVEFYGLSDADIPTIEAL